MEEENCLLIDAARLLMRSAQLLEQAVIESDPDDDTDVKEWLLMRRDELRNLADFIYPPKPNWPANVVPFVPRTKTG